MKIIPLRRLGVCLLAFTLASFAPETHAAPKGRGKQAGQSKRSGVTNPSRQLFARGRELRDQLTPPSDHHFHLYAHYQPINDQAKEIIGSPSGMFPIVVHERGRWVDFNIYFPAAKAGESALVRTLDEGSLVPMPRRIRDGKKANQPTKRKKSSRLVPGQNQLAVSVQRDGRLGFRYRYGKELHAQRIEIRFGQRRAYLNLHLHLPGDDQDH